VVSNEKVLNYTVLDLNKNYNFYIKFVFIRVYKKNLRYFEKWIEPLSLFNLAIGSATIIPKHFESGPTRARPAHEPYWTDVGRYLEARQFFWLEPDPKCCF
jgi:hypothetical protein